MQMKVKKMFFRKTENEQIEEIRKIAEHRLNLLIAIVESDDHGQGIDFATAMERARKEVEA